MDLKIVSDGNSLAVVDAETGQPVKNVESVDVEWRENGVPTATIRVVRISLDIRASIARLTD